MKCTSNSWKSLVFFIGWVFHIQLLEVLAAPTSSTVKSEDPSVTRFRQYLRLKAVHPNPDYASSIEWIKKQAEEIGLEYNILHFEAPALFAIWLTWNGTNPSLPSILLNSHIDVVPVDEARWTHDPFGAEKDENGNIYARGTQDMKGTAVQYLEAIRNFKSQGVTPLRNVHVSFVPDEEINGNKGMKPFIATKEFHDLNIGLALDEGLLEDSDTLQVVWTERVVYRTEFIATGSSGHGSFLLENTAAEKIQRIVNAMLGLRTQEKNKMETNNLTLADVTTINLTVMKGGQQGNIVPAELAVTFDIRVTPSWNLTYVQELLEGIGKSAGPGVRVNYISPADRFAETPLSPDNIWWTAFKDAAKEYGYTLVPAIHPAATDIRYLREIGTPAFGFTTTRNTPSLMHDHNEFLNEANFLDGIKVYEQFLPKLFNLGPTGSNLLKQSVNKQGAGNGQTLKTKFDSFQEIRPREILQKFGSQYSNE